MAKLTKSGKALYSGTSNASGCARHDLIVYYFTEDFFRLVVNSATRQKRPLLDYPRRLHRNYRS
ncbi:hypothetical protein ACNKHL_17510 [Shigella flexneri]